MDSSAPSTTPPHKLERIGRYRIVRPLSKGGMALVYEARRESLAGVSPRVAIKIILPDFAASDTFQELFINEARLGAAMEHQNLVRIQDFDRDGESFFIVMEYVDGLTLRRAISLCARNEIPIPMGVIAEVGRQACDGLHFAHTARDDQGSPLHLVHRDIKPSNLILDPQGLVKILDFGIARGSLMREKKGAVKGTWGYMAPEQAKGEDVTAAADVFGLGTVLFEMASREPLFQKKKPAEIKRLLLDDHAARMAATLDPMYSPMIPVLVRALQRDPAGRFETAADLSRALSALLPDPISARDEVVRFYKVINALNEGLPVPASTRSLGVATHPGSTQATQGSIVQTSAGSDSSSWPMILGFLLVGAVGVGVVTLALGLTLAPHLLQPGASEEPAGTAEVKAPTEAAPATPAESTEPRPPPAESVAPPQPPKPVAPVESSGTASPPPAPEKVVVVVDRTAPPAPAITELASVPTPVVTVSTPPPQPKPVATDGTGFLTISARQPAEVYVDGQFIRKTPLVNREFPAGAHVITIVAADGRQKRFDVELEADQTIRRVWDFDRGEWRN